MFNFNGFTRAILVLILAVVIMLMVTIGLKSVIEQSATQPTPRPDPQLWYSYDVTYIDKDQVICYSQYVTDTSETPQTRRPVGWSCLPLDQTHAQWRYPTYIPPTPTPGGQ